jgi:hypothetical protein
MKCTNEEYEQYKNDINDTKHHIMTRNDRVWVLLYISVKQYETFKEYGLNITIDSPCLTTCKKMI